MRLCTTLLALTFLCGTAVFAEQDPTTPVAQRMTTAAQNYLASLSDSQKSVGVMSFDDPQRVDWTNVPKRHRKGIQLRDMSIPQRELCHKLLEASLSADGYAKAVQIMVLEFNLHEGEKHLTNGHLRDPERYFLTIFGTPEMTGTWGYSFEGHHLSLNFVIKDGVVIGDSPSFWGANPAIVSLFVDKGPEVGVRTLTVEEQTAFDLVNSLNIAQQAKAIVAATAPKDYRNVGKSNPPSAPEEGLSAEEMTDEQRAILQTLLNGYVGHLADPVAAERLREIEKAGIENIRFAWLGATEPGIGHSYRVQGPTFVLELVNDQVGIDGKKANHIHSVWRSLGRDFGFNTAAK
ncbi:MAG TPA: DUF3500 domain-containing protein [Planctomicrobium sp.]|nr:DUF3500 domain-containing protein [Planctomicrobium sp.]